MKEILMGTITIANYQLEMIIDIILSNDYTAKLSKSNNDKIKIDIYGKENIENLYIESEKN